MGAISSVLARMITKGPDTYRCPLKIICPRLQPFAKTNFFPLEQAPLPEALLLFRSALDTLRKSLSPAHAVSNRLQPRVNKLALARPILS